MLSHDITVNINGRDLIKESHITINPRCKYVVVGINGIGKTSLINEIIKHLDSVDYLLLQQDITIEENETCLDFLLKVHPGFELNKILLAYEDIDDIEEYESIVSQLEFMEWDKFESEAKRILAGLSFINPETTLTQNLSGGWRMRLALAKALIMFPNLLILDEPSNHLDFEANIWLTKYLSEYPKAIILITHQIELINAFEDVVIWYIGNPYLTGNCVTTIRGNYYSLQQFKTTCEENNTSNYLRYQNKLLDFKRKRPSPTSKQVEDYNKQIVVPRPPLDYYVNIEWNDVAKNTKSIVQFNNISFSYGDKVIFDNINYRIYGDSRHVLVGPNGAGKTTLLKLILELEIGSDRVISDQRNSIAYYNQQIIDNLPLEMTPIELLQSINSELSVGDCKAILGRLSLKRTNFGDPTKVKIENLSGGQKARVALARLQINEPNLLLLDEVTNHLDIESIEALIDGLNSYNGAIVLITHDLHLIKRLNNVQIFKIQGKSIIEIRGGIDEYISSLI